MADGIRARHRAEVEAEILRVAHAQLADVGAAALSLRAVARELGMVSSGIYRYVASRDELLTLLIVDSYDDLGDAVDAALAQVPPERLVERFAVIGRTVRRWALARPHDFALLYGSPVPHYEAPPERTTPAGTRVQLQLLDLLARASAARTRSDDTAGGAAGPHDETGGVLAAGATSLAPLLADSALAGAHVAPDLLLRGLAAWASVLGTVTAEVFEQYGPGPSDDPAALFEAVLTLAASLVGLPERA